MNAAICSRVTPLDGQNWSLAGGLQPNVTPASASQPMSPWNAFVSGTSVNPSAATAAICNPIKTAIPTIAAATCTRRFDRLTLFSHRHFGTRCADSAAKI
ncbi:MAG: hypothetical protein ACE5GC_09485 [Acidimicrobiia bacterium]